MISCEKSLEVSLIGFEETISAQGIVDEFEVRWLGRRGEVSGARSDLAAQPPCGLRSTLRRGRSSELQGA